MRRNLQVNALLALLDATEEAPMSGEELAGALAAAGRSVSPAALLTTLLELEAGGHVGVRRLPAYAFHLTEKGRAAAYHAGGGKPMDVVLVMADLVGFTEFTERHGDEAARDASHLLAGAAEHALRAAGGRLVKSLGDGVLGVVGPDRDAERVVRQLAGEVVRDDGTPWSLRAAAHHGFPIEHRGDVYGADVNLVARLCALAGPGELVLTVAADGDDTELVAVRGIAEPVAIRRVGIA